MKADEIIKKYVKGEQDNENVAVIAISQSNKIHWYHVHRDEDIPKEDYDIAILLDKE